MKKLFFLLLISSCAAGKYAVKNAPTAASSITKEDLKKQLTIIASAEMEGRETGTIGQRRAAAYIESQFKEIGLQTPAGQEGYQQFYPLYTDSLVSSVLSVNDQPSVFGDDYLTQLNINPNAKITAGKVVFVGYGIEDPAYSDYQNADVSGKIVAFFNGEPKKDGKYFLAGDATLQQMDLPGYCRKISGCESKRRDWSTTN